MPGIKKILSGNSYILIYLVVILIINLFLINLPLAGILGYEFSAINSLLLVLLSGFFSISAWKKAKQEQWANRDFLKYLAKSFSLFLLIPFLIGLVKSLLGLSCSLWDGILFYIVITAPSVIIGSGLGLLSYFLVKKIPVIILLVMILLIASIPVAEIFYYPQIYFYNPLIGFFPGTIYDEGLSVNFQLILYRLINIIFFISLGSILLWGTKRSGIKIIYIIAYSILLPAIFTFISPYLGFSTTPERLERELSGSVETEHFIIHYSQKSDKDLILVSALHHEYYYSELSSFLKVKPNEKIISYIFEDAEQKGELFGAENADVAKPWLRQIYTTPDNYNSTLKHEIAHIFTGEFGSGIFKVAIGFNPGLIEGIAVAADPFYDDYSVDYPAAVAIKNGYKVNLKNIFSATGFFTSVSSLSYIQAGSFVKYLIKNYGVEKFKKLYVTSDFKAVYGKSIDKLQGEFYEHLSKVNTQGSEHTADYYFGRKTIFQKVCPRYVAERLKKGFSFFSNKQYSKSLEIFEHLYDVSSSYAPLLGMVNSLIKLEQPNKADSILSANINEFKNTSYYYNLELKLGDISVLLNNYSRADSIYRALIKQNPNYTLFYLGNMRRELLSRENLLKLYIQGNDLDKYLILREFNSGRYSYSTIPVMVDLSGLLDEEYDLFLRQFNKTIEVNSLPAAYAVFKLSGYSLEHLDFEKARRLAAYALRYKDDLNLNYLLEEHFRKTNWFRNNAKGILDELK